MQEESYKGDCHSGTYGGRSIRKDLRDQQQASQEVLVEKNLPANSGDKRDLGSVPGSGKTPGGGHGNPLQYSCLRNSMDTGAWRAVQSMGLQRVGHD